MATPASNDTKDSKLAVVVLAAGKGTRMKSGRAKVLHPVAGRPMIEYPVELARSLGAARIVCVLGHQEAEVRAQLAARFGEGAVDVAVQHEQRGTGHAVQVAAEALSGFIEEGGGRVLILYGDTPLLTRELLVRLVDATSDGLLGLVTFRAADPFGYGRIVRDAVGGQLQRIVEHKDASESERAIDEVNAGLYCASASFLFAALGALGTNNAQGELYLTDVVAAAATREPVRTVVASAEEVSGVNDRVDLARADAVMRRRLVEALQRGGTTVMAPETVFVEPGVVCGEDAVIGPNVQLRGATRIGAGAHIDAGCILTDAIIAEGAHLKPYCVVSESSVGRGAEVGPFAHLRPGSELGDKVKVGNFVETKKARLGTGAKASHLSYLGDCEVGAAANIGCGTITCNYDGYSKFRTVIGEGAFIGSDTQLVAPVTVGARAIVAAGTTVVEDVPEGALALSRTPQIAVPGYYDKKRQREGEKRQREGEKRQREGEKRQREGEKRQREGEKRQGQADTSSK